jgi:hypothetical protein
MPKTTDTRPLVERLQKRVLKLHGGNAVQVNQIAGGYLTDSDSALHQQSVEEITRLITENERLRKHIQGYRDLKDAPFLKNYAPYRDLDNSPQS